MMGWRFEKEKGDGLDLETKGIERERFIIGW